MSAQLRAGFRQQVSNRCVTRQRARDGEREVRVRIARAVVLKIRARKIECLDTPGQRNLKPSMQQRELRGKVSSIRLLVRVRLLRDQVRRRKIIVLTVKVIL